jgi:flagellar hook-associated protein FlgK
MSGYRVTLDIAKGALAASQNNLAVTGHNVANVGTEGYSRQTASLAVASPMSLGTLQFGRGVTIESVQRQANELLASRLRNQESILAGDEQGVMYVENLETLFDIQSENELSSMIADFWNTWQDLSNNPAGVSERAVVFQNGNQLSERLNNLDKDLGQLERDINQEIETGVGQINGILDKIATLNIEINLSTDIGRTANDQMDSRDRLVTDLAKLMSINTIDQRNGYLTILNDSGYPLVVEGQAYPLDVDGGRVYWQTTGGGQIDISDDISSGKISGWLDIKEQEVMKMRAQLDTISNQLIWQVNKVHSQGVGSSFFNTEQNGSYTPITTEGGVLSTLSYGNKIDYTKDFKMWTKDSGNPPDTTSIEVDMGISDAGMTYVGGAAASPLNKYYFTVTTAGTVGPGSDDPVITWAKADYTTDPPGLPGGGGAVTVNGSGAGNFVVDGMTFTIDPGYLVSGNTFTVNTDAGGTAAPVNISHDPLSRANSVLDNYVFRVVSGGGDVANVSDANPMVIEWRNSREIKTITLDDPTDLTFDVDGMELTFNSGMYFNNDVFSITTDENGFQLDPDGTFSLETSSEWHWTVESFKDQFNAQSTAAGAHVTGYVNLDGSIKFVPDYGYSFAFSDDKAEDSGLVAALGINNFFEGDDSSSIKVKDDLEFADYIAAARLNGGERNGMAGDAVLGDPSLSNLTISAANGNNTFRFTENDVSYTVTLSNATYTSKTDFHSLAADIQDQMNAASAVSPPSTYKVVYDEANNQFVFSENDGSNLVNLEIFWSENAGTAAALGFKSIDNVYLPPTGDYGINDNKNASALAELQYTDFSMAKWNFTRGQDVQSDTMTTHIEGAYQDMLSALGVTGMTLKQNLMFGDVMVEQLTQQRDSISGVSIDEEMVKLIAYQQSYVAASKLIKTVDEMLQSLMATK